MSLFGSRYFYLSFFAPVFSFAVFFIWNEFLFGQDKAIFYSLSVFIFLLSFFDGFKVAYYRIKRDHRMIRSLFIPQLIFMLIFSLFYILMSNLSLLFFPVLALISLVNALASNRFYAKFVDKTNGDLPLILAGAVFRLVSVSFLLILFELNVHYFYIIFIASKSFEVMLLILLYKISIHKILLINFFVFDAFVSYIKFILFSLDRFFGWIRNYMFLTVFFSTQNIDIQETILVSQKFSDAFLEGPGRFIEQRMIAGKQFIFLFLFFIFIIYAGITGLVHINTSFFQIDSFMMVSATLTAVMYINAVLLFLVNFYSNREIFYFLLLGLYSLVFIVSLYLFSDLVLTFVFADLIVLFILLLQCRRSKKYGSLETGG